MSKKVREDAKNLITNPSDEHYYTQQEIDSHSITPNTFRGRTLNQFKYLSEDFTWFIDEYEHGQSAVKRYGINAAKFKIKIDDVSTWPKGTKIIKSNPPSSDQNSDGNKTNKTAVELWAKSVKHQPLEIFLITKAVDYLLDPKTQSKAVLIDIFRRDMPSVDMVLDKKGLLEVHTVLLYKTDVVNSGNSKYDPKYNILIIDPSNFSFSSHIANLQDEVSSKLVYPNAFVKFVALHDKKLSVYKTPPGTVNPGSKPNEYRDCTDIAVKLAFGLNDPASEVLTDITNPDLIKKHSTIQKVSNQPDIDKAIFFDTYNIPARIKQSSDIKAVEAFSSFQKSIDRIKKTMHNVLKDQTKKIEISDWLKTNFTKKVETSEKPDKILGDLLSMTQEYSYKCMEALVIDEKSLLKTETDSVTKIIGEII